MSYYIMKKKDLRAVTKCSRWKCCLQSIKSYCKVCVYPTIWKRTFINSVHFNKDIFLVDFKEWILSWSLPYNSFTRSLLMNLKSVLFFQKNNSSVQPVSFFLSLFILFYFFYFLLYLVPFLSFLYVCFVCFVFSIFSCFVSCLLVLSCIWFDLFCFLSSFWSSFFFFVLYCISLTFFVFFALPCFVFFVFFSFCLLCLAFFSFLV